jgi:malonyl-CoA decarboxylase
MSLRRARPIEEALRQVRDRALGLTNAGRLRRHEPAAHLPVKEQRRLVQLLHACLEPHLGEVIARARAAEIAALYLGLDEEGRARFFQLVATGSAIDPTRVELAADAFHKAVAESEAGRPASTDGPTSQDDNALLLRRADPAVAKAASALREAATPAWDRLFRLFCGLDHGVKFTVDLRADLLAALAAARRGLVAEGFEQALLQRFDNDLRAVLKALFDVGLLQLHRITWQSPAALLEKLIRYEAVHAITSWADLKNRLREDRRCYAFLHPGMPDEPLIFVEVALSTGLAGRIGPLLDLETPITVDDDADSAIFYSISSCQDGLTGVSLGDFLIKQVVTDLARELPGVKHFATLSPIPGFRVWLTDELQRSPVQLLGLLDGEQRTALASLSAIPPTPRNSNGGHRSGLGASGTASGGLARLLDDNSWLDDPATASTARPAIVRLAARYLTSIGEDQRVVDRVGNFHLTNGARVERVNWLANPSQEGVRQSLGVMVNYRYDLDRIERNHTDYVLRGRVAISPAVSRLLG